jgi:tetratricopeptide (TPR) repeat protein
VKTPISWKEISVPTYPLGPENPNPPFDSGLGEAGPSTYPYPAIGTSTQKTDQTYNACVLENEYLRVTLLPQLDSHIHQIYHKSTKRNIPSASEIELNFSKSHPINTATEILTDGSGTIWTGAIDQTLGTQYHMGLTLKPQTDALEIKIVIVNHSSEPKLYTCSTNCAKPQTTHKMLQPHTIATWTKRWDPQSGTERPSYADNIISKFETLDLSRRDDPQSLAITALKNREHRRDDQAEKLYLQALEKQDDFIPALQGIAELYIARGLNQKAIDPLKKILTINRQQPFATYLLALASAKTERVSDAINLFNQLQREPHLSSLAQYELAPLYFKQGDIEKAAESYKAAWSGKMIDHRALLFRCACLRSLGQWQTCKPELAQIPDYAQTDSLCQWEELFLKSNPASLLALDRDALLKKIPQPQNSTPAQHLIDAGDYLEKGFLEEALIIIRSAKPSSNPLIIYAASYLKSLLPGKEKTPPPQVKPDSLTGVFPNTFIDEKSLEFAITTDPSDACAKYLKALLLYSRRRRNEAVEIWRSIREQMENFPTIHRNLGWHYWKIENDPATAAEHYTRALKCDPGDPHIAADLNCILKKLDPTNPLFSLAEVRANTRREV